MEILKVKDWKKNVSAQFTLIDFQTVYLHRCRQTIKLNGTFYKQFQNQRFIEFISASPDKIHITINGGKIVKADDIMWISHEHSFAVGYH